MSDTLQALSHPLLRRQPATPREWVEYNRVLLEQISKLEDKNAALEARVTALETP